MPGYPLGMLVKHINIQIEKSLNQNLRDMNLTSSQMHVLMYLLARQGRRVTMRDVEEFLHQSHVTVTGLIQRLEQKGFVTVTVDPDDRRYRLLAATPAAAQVREALHRHRSGIEQQLLDGLTGEEADTLKALLLQVAGNMGSTLPPPPPHDPDQLPPHDPDQPPALCADCGCIPNKGGNPI